MSKFQPTKEQERIFKFVEKRSENILIDAKAGAGKTTTIVEIAKLIPNGKSITFLAFNKHIQEELSKKLPNNVRCQTTYAAGAAAIKKVYGDSIQFDEFKIDGIIKKFIQLWRSDSDWSRVEEKNYIADLKKMANICRLTLTLEPSYIPNVGEKYDVTVDDKMCQRICDILEVATTDKTKYDFTDMVYMGAADPKIWFYPQDYVIIDECQDLNKAQQKIIEKMLKRDRKTKKLLGRLISVGDPSQNIYGFAASSEKSFDWFRSFPNTEVLPLSYSFRCARNIIAEANKIVPDIKALPTAEDGIVRSGSTIEEVKDGDFVICRTTIPLIKMFFELLKRKKKVVIKGADIGLSLIDLIGDANDIYDLESSLNTKLKVFKNNLKLMGVLIPEEHSGFSAYQDKVDVLKYIIGQVDSIQSLKDHIKSIFTEELTGIVLMTAHKSKGLEANRVFIIRPDKLPLQCKKEWQNKQELNLKYVAITRAKNELVYDFEWKDDDDE